ncbi:MAG: uL13 family ribosomal protein [Candidatus Nomurabacteria bacterium]|nr:uL13 family ribosomal protein [Candidatus Nomurabacteria bacterium]
MKKETTQINKIAPKVIDASGRTLGRVATEAAMHLMGKTSAKFERNVFSGLPVTIVNASKLKITMKKLEEIQHTKYSGYPGGLRITKGKETMEKKGLKELVKLAIYQMLPDNKLRRKMMLGLEITD